MNDKIKTLYKQYYITYISLKSKTKVKLLLPPDYAKDVVIKLEYTFLKEKR